MTATELRLPQGELARALRALPALYADAYRLYRSGLDALGIAIHLEIDPGDVDDVVREAERRLEAITTAWE